MISLCVAKGRHGVAFPTAIASAACIEPAFSFFFARKLNAIGGFGGRSFIRLVRSCNRAETSPAAAASPPPSLKRFGPKFRFCPVCGGASEERVPTGEHEPRNVCSACGFVHYQNPKMVVGCLVEHEQKILLCRRSIQPSYGLWTLPAGYMELGESAAEGAVRETREEAQAQVEPISMFAHLDIPAIGQVLTSIPERSSRNLCIDSPDIIPMLVSDSDLVCSVQSYIIFRARFSDSGGTHFSAGPESLECALFELDQIPFDQIAFSTISVALKLYIQDVKDGHIRVHSGVIDKTPGASPSDPQGFVLRDYLPSSS